MEEEQLSRLDAWLRSILWDRRLPDELQNDTPTTNVETPSFEIHRLKARLHIRDGTVKMVQGVRDIFEIKDAPKHEGDEHRSLEQNTQGKLVFIGRHLSDVAFKESYHKVVERPPKHEIS